MTRCLLVALALIVALFTVATAEPARALEAATPRAGIWQAQANDRARDRRGDFSAPLAPRVPRKLERKGPGPARDAVQRGEILPLETVMARVQSRYPGRLLDVKLDEASGRWTYHLKMLTREGRVLNIAVDARTARILGIAGNR